MIQFKQTPIGKIPEDWEVVRLEDIVEINKESRDPTRKTPNDKFLYIDIESIEGGAGVIKTIKEIIGKDAPLRARRVVHYNDVIMSTVRPYLKAFAIAPKEYDNQICSTGFAVFTCKEKILPLYLLYALFSRSVIEQCNRMMVGGQYPALNNSQVAKIKIPLPSLLEQRKIAEILSTVDEAIQKVDLMITKTERLKKGLMQELLTKGIGHKEFKDSEVGRIPKEWEVEPTEKICTKVTDGTHDTPKPVEIGYFLVTSKHIKTGKIDFSEAYFIKKSDFDEINKRSKVDIGDVLFSMIGTVGMTTVVEENYPPFAIKNIGLFKTGGNLSLAKWLHYYFQSKFAKVYLKNNIKGTTQKYIPLYALRNLPVVLPPLLEQQKIAEILSTFDKKLELERKRKDKLERIKKGLMKDLLTGKRRVEV